MTEQIQHFLDRDHKFNGSDGEWTICGEPWRPQPANVERCPKCVAAVVEYSDTMRQGQR